MLRPEHTRQKDIQDLVIAPQDSHCKPSQVTATRIPTVLRSLPRRPMTSVQQLGKLPASAVLASVGGRPSYFAKKDWEAQLITSPCHTAITRGEMTG